MVRDASTVTLGVWDQPVLVWLWDLSTAPSHFIPRPVTSRQKHLLQLPGQDRNRVPAPRGWGRGDGKNMWAEQRRSGEETDGPGWDWGRAGAHTNAQGCPQDPRGMAQGPGGSWVFCPGPGHFHTGRAAPAALLQPLFPVFNLTFPY